MPIPYGATLLPTEEDSDDDDLDDLEEIPCGGPAYQLLQLKSTKKQVRLHLQKLDAIWVKRRQPWIDKAARLDDKIVLLQRAQREERMAAQGPPPPGPEWLSWVSEPSFGGICHSVVILNLVCMVLSYQQDLPHEFQVPLDHLFLTWYLTELAVKSAYFQETLLVGRWRVVWWNWLDVGIVGGGVLEEWLVPLLFPSSNLSFLRFLRVFRVLRVLRLAKAFFFGDLEWTTQPAFEMLIAGVIAVNSVTMWLELDYHWPIWPYVENGFLLVYTFELAVRLKRDRHKFFTDLKNIGWNMLDLIMVIGCILDLWLMPVIHFASGMINGEGGEATDEGSFSGVLSLLKMMRILRVLRLVRLLRTIKPLYRLLIGVAEALMAMQWVMVLTLLTLYAGAITWTTLVGKGMIETGVSETDFETVPQSLFSLFKLMNGDMSVVEPIISTPFGQLLFAGFMIVSKWVVLAILTSVVSDNMMTASAKSVEEDKELRKHSEQQIRAERTLTIFQEVDVDRCGCISEQEWRRLKDDPVLSAELLDTTNLPLRVLDQLFECLSEANTLKKGRLAGLGGRVLHCDDFIQHLDDVLTPADRGTVLQVSAQVKLLQEKVIQWQATKKTPDTNCIACSNGVPALVNSDSAALGWPDSHEEITRLTTLPLRQTDMSAEAAPGTELFQRP